MNGQVSRGTREPGRAGGASALVGGAGHRGWGDRGRLLVGSAKWLVGFCCIGILALTGCKPGEYNFNTTTDVRARQYTPEEEARAWVIQAQADKLFKENDIAYQIGSAEAQVKAATSVLRVQAENHAIISKADAEARTVTTNANAAAIGTMALHISWAVVVLGLGLGVALIIPILVLAGVFYIGIELWTRKQQAVLRERTMTVTAYINNVRVTYFIFVTPNPDGRDEWHIVDTLGDTQRGLAETHGVSAMRTNLLEAAMMNRYQEPLKQPGVLVTLFRSLFNRPKIIQPARQAQPAPEPRPAHFAVTLNGDGDESANSATL